MRHKYLWRVFRANVNKLWRKGAIFVSKFLVKGVLL